MATTSDPNDFSAAQEEMQRQVDALEAQKDQLNSRYQSPRLLGKEFAGMYDDNHKRQLQGIQSKINSIQREFRNATQQQQHLVMDQVRQRAEALAAQKLQEAQREKALKETHSKLGAILGVKPDKVTDALDKSFYDPITHRVVVPQKNAAETSSEQKSREKSYVALKDKVGGYAADNLATGRPVAVNLENILGKNPLPYKEDSDGNRIYTNNGKPYATIPSGKFEDLKKEYDEITSKPIEGSKQIDPGTFNAVRQQIGLLGGDAPPDIVGEAQAVASRGRLAQPAIRAAYPDSYQSDNPGMFGFGDVPSVTERVAPALAVQSSDAPNSYKPISLPSAPVTLRPPMVDQASQNNVFDAEGKLVPNQPSLLQTGVAQRLPEKTVTLPQRGILPAITQTLPAQTMVAPFQNNPLGSDIAMPQLPFADQRIEAFRPGYETADQQAYNAYRQLAPGATDAQIESSLKKATTALGGNADPERVRNFVVGDIQAANTPGLMSRMSSLGAFGLPAATAILAPGIPGGAVSPGLLLGDNVASDAARGLYQSYGPPVAAALSAPDNLSLLDQNRIRAIQSNAIPPTTTLDQYQDYLNQSQQAVENSVPTFYNP